MKMKIKFETVANIVVSIILTFLYFHFFGRESYVRYDKKAKIVTELEEYHGYMMPQPGK